MKSYILEASKHDNIQCDIDSIIKTNVFNLKIFDLFYKSCKSCKSYSPHKFASVNDKIIYRILEEIFC